MDLPNLKDLKAILKLCRSQGVNKITLADMAIEFGDMPMTAKDGAMVSVEEDAAVTPTDEELAYWSSAPDPLALRDSGAQ